VFDQRGPAGILAVAKLLSPVANFWVGHCAHPGNLKRKTRKTILIFLPKKEDY
jgi:hypothetical protein